MYGISCLWCVAIISLPSTLFNFYELHLVFEKLYHFYIAGASSYNILFIGDFRSLLSRSDAGGYIENILGDAEDPRYFSW
jgi:hypothetical protein